MGQPNTVLASADLRGVQFDGCDERDGGYGYGSFGQSGWDATFPRLDLQNGMPGADTWYPYWGADGRWYSSYTDGTVGGVHSQSGGSNPSMHGQVVMEPAGGHRVISDCHFAVQLNHFIPGFLSYSVPIFLK